ncbi:MAG: hypothetical protein UR50_C0004G0049 [Parcubacteria group bacterium GW2011_GWC1_34_10]|nr:MAG: hypothetical protein UR50_C0004G0049 [Parcubacteria group bacterium GW2011_GWC1_34_10]
MDILEKLFGSAAKVKLIKLFLLNPETVFDAAEAGERAKVSRAVTRKEILNLEKINFLRQKSYIKEVRRQKNRRMQIFRKRTNGWTLDYKFPYIEAVKTFLSSISPFNYKEMVKKISRSGKIQLLIVAGIFIKNNDSRVDLLVVGDNLKQNQLDNTVKTIESEVGKEIRYAIFETSEFNYRYSIFDKLARDILDYPHKKIINKLNL